MTDNKEFEIDSKEFERIKKKYRGFFEARDEIIDMRDDTVDHYHEEDMMKRMSSRMDNVLELLESFRKENNLPDIQYEQIHD